MNLATRLENFRADNQYAIAVQAKRLIATRDNDLIKYAVELGLTLARSRQRHTERLHIKETGHARLSEPLTVRPGRVTGSVVVRPGRRTRNAVQQLVLETWRINGEKKLGDATADDLGEAIRREGASVTGHRKNIKFYTALRAPLEGTTNPVRSEWNEQNIRPQIETVYGEFRTREAA